MNELSEQARALAAAGRADRPTAADRARLTQAVRAGIAAAPLARLPFRPSTTATVSVVVAALGAALWVGLLLLPGRPVPQRAVPPAPLAMVGPEADPSTGAVAAGPEVPAVLGEPVVGPLQQPDAIPGEQAAVPARATRRSLRAEPAAAAVVAQEPAEAPVAVPSAPSDVKSPDDAARGAAVEQPGKVPAPAASTLLEELRLLRAAQSALAGGQPGVALGALDEHQASYPQGLLREERDAARVLALCDLGRQAEACQLGRAFLTASPRSPQAGRVSASCVQRCGGETK